MPFTSIPRRQLGLSLIEILIGMVIGLVGILVMLQTMTAWSTRSRTTASGSSAQAAGTLAMFQLERDVKQAGMGFGTAAPETMGCVVWANDGGARDFDFRLLSVQIVDGGVNGESDRINVLYGNSAFFTDTALVTGSASASKTLNRRTGLQRGDLVIVAGNDSGTPASSECVLKQITDNTAADGVTVAHAVGTYADFYTGSAQTARFNAAAASVPTFSDGGTIISLGPRPRYNVWQVQGGRVLAHADLIHGATPFEVAEGVINLQAQYGIDGDNNGQIADAEWTAAAPTDWTRVLAIRVGMLVRSQQFEKRTVNAGESSWTATKPSWIGGPFQMLDVGGTVDSNVTDSPSNWRYYRYRVYEKVIPLRNMIWGTSP